MLFCFFPPKVTRNCVIFSAKAVFLFLHHKPITVTHSGQINVITCEAVDFRFLNVLCFATVCEYSRCKRGSLSFPQKNWHYDASDEQVRHKYKQKCVVSHYLLFKTMWFDILVGFELRLTEPLVLIPRLAFSGSSGEFPNGFHLTKLASSRWRLFRW